MAGILLSSFSVLHCARYICLLWGYSPSMISSRLHHSIRKALIRSWVTSTQPKPRVSSCQLMPPVSLRGAGGHCLLRIHSSFRVCPPQLCIRVTQDPKLKPVLFLTHTHSLGGPVSIRRISYLEDSKTSSPDLSRFHANTDLTFFPLLSHRYLKLNMP